MIPLIDKSSSDVVWLSLASASTLAGNATIIGAMVNLIVLEIAKKNKINISFMEFFKAGIITCIFTFIISIGVLALQQYFNLLQFHGIQEVQKKYGFQFFQYY
eukprot:TRINITY_DN1308_c0_g1_i1.p4 TRINITY_DN1308_c0_g1~~TRINITY_DN1308_c0_g1_i1.p4  ORF type:complete len:103 (+),score=9.34 TRINITY_DN1308_c0_g1_i1:254-562(+)